MGIAFNTDFEPNYGQILEIAPGVRRLVANNPNPFTFQGTGVYILGRGEVAIIDPGPSMDDHLDTLLGGLGPDEVVSHILVTHTHSDHTAGVPKLVERTGATTYGYGPHGEVPDVDPMEEVTFDEYFTAEEKATIDKQWADIPDELKREGPDTSFVPDVAVRHGEVIAGADWSVEVVHTPGHTSNHICFALDTQGNNQGTERILFSGDHVMGWATSVIAVPDGDLFDYMASLRLLLDRDDTVYWPTHGPAIANPHDYVRSFIEHRTGRENQIVAALTAKSSTIKDLVPQMYVETDKRLWRAAASSVFSHLVALHREGRVSCDTAEPSLTATWTLLA